MVLFAQPRNVRILHFAVRVTPFTGPHHFTYVAGFASAAGPALYAHYYDHWSRSILSCVKRNMLAAALARTLAKEYDLDSLQQDHQVKHQPAILHIEQVVLQLLYRIQV